MSIERDPHYLTESESNLPLSRKLALDHQEAVVSANLNLSSARERAEKNEDSTIYPGLGHLVESGFGDNDTNIRVLKEAYSLTTLEALEKASNARDLYHRSIGTILYYPPRKSKFDY